jgi:hypothetical protein
MARMIGRHDRSWHLDRRVPIAFILAILAQTAGGVWWAGSIDSRVAAMQRWIDDNRRLDTRLAVVEVGQNRLKEDLGEVKDLLRRIDDRLGRQGSLP